MVLSAQDILHAVDLKREEVEVPEWGGTVLVQEMSAAALADFQDYSQGPDGQPDGKAFLAKLAVRSLVDGEGRRLFKDPDWADLAGKSLQALKRVTDVALRLNYLTPQAVEDAEKN